MIKLVKGINKSKVLVELRQEVMERVKYSYKPEAYIEAYMRGAERLLQVLQERDSVAEEYCLTCTRSYAPFRDCPKNIPMCLRHEERKRMQC